MSLRRSALPLLIGALLLAPSPEPAYALVTHNVLVEFSDLAGTVVASDSDLATGATDVGRAILAEISTLGISASASVGPAGDLGIAGRQFGAGSFRGVIGVSNSEIRNMSPVARRATANFVIDGGRLRLDSAPGASLTLELEIFSSGGADNECIDRLCFQSKIELRDDSTSGGPPLVSFLGDDIGAGFDGNSAVDIPLSFQSIDLGIVPANGSVSIGYELEIASTVPRFAEIFDFAFQDPLSIDGDGPIQVVFSSVPEARGMLVLLPLLLLAARLRPRLQLRKGPAIFFALSLLLLLPIDAEAIIVHDLRATFRDASGAEVAFDQAGASGLPPLEFPADIGVSIDEPEGGLVASVGRFGNFGIQGDQGGPGQLLVGVSIDNTSIENRTSVDLRASANFIIDGGQLILDSAPGASLTLDLRLTSESISESLCPNQVCFSSFIELLDDGTGSATSARFFGDDIGASFDGSAVVDIPLSFQSVDLGVIPAGGFIDLAYSLTIGTDVPEFAEGLFFRFEDPLSVDEMGLEFVFSAVPEPSLVQASLLLLAPVLRARSGYRRAGARSI